MGACLSILEKASKAEKLEAENANLKAGLAAAGGGGGGGHAPPGAWQQHNQPQQHAPHQPAHAAASGAGAVQVLFFPDKGMPCRNFLEGRQCRRNNCDYVHEATSLVTLLGFLHRATTALDICVFTITCNEIADAIIAAKNRGVAVRVISDNDQAASQGSDIQTLRQAGIPVRLDRDSNHMHHKFAIIDYKTLINGSFNWTRNAVLGNQENVTITENPALAQQFGMQFNRLWEMFA